MLQLNNEKPVTIQYYFINERYEKLQVQSLAALGPKPPSDEGKYPLKQFVTVAQVMKVK